MGIILIFPESPDNAETQVVLYARASSRSQQEELDCQIHRLRDYATAQGDPVTEEVAEIGSGLNSRRKKLLRLLQDSQVHTLMLNTGIDGRDLGLTVSIPAWRPQVVKSWCLIRPNATIIWYTR